MLSALYHEATVTVTPSSAHPSIADPLRKLLCQFEVNQTNGSRVIATLIPAPQSLMIVGCSDTYAHSQCLHHQDLPLVPGLLFKPQ